MSAVYVTVVPLPTAPVIVVSPPSLRYNKFSLIRVVSENTVVVVPDTVKLPSIITLLVALISLNTTLLEGDTSCPIEISPFEIETPVPAEKWARTSFADGPVYVIIPFEYVREPSPLKSVTLIASCTL